MFYTNQAGNIVIASYLSDLTNSNLVDPATATPLLMVAHPTFFNHNGGMLAFGPNGCLYAGIGDGGSSVVSGADPNSNSQNVNMRFGKLLRINPVTGGPCVNNNTFNPFVGGGAPEVWSLGLRNPWRF